jgi:hypothetical protein
VIGDHPWQELPVEVAAALRPTLADVADEIIEAVRTVPAYSRPLDGAFGEGIRAGVHGALQHFLVEVEAGGPVARGDIYRRLGRGEMRAGRSLDSLLSAYRIGARVAWRRFAAVGEAAGLEPSTLYLTAEALFAYIDVLSAESAEGHALEQSAVAGEAEMFRRRLVRVLLRQPQADPETVQAAASAAGWDLPRTLAALVAWGVASAGSGSASGSLPMLRAAQLPPGSIADVVGDVVCVIVPDPDAPGRRGELERLVARLGVTAALGTTAAWQEAGTSFTRARAMLEIAGSARAGAANADGALIVTRERLGELLLASEPALAREFAADRLEPLRGESPASRERLTETLRAWLAEQGRLTAVARRMGVHPQTARYRIGRLRELFGAALDDPEERFWLELALRVGPAATAAPVAPVTPAAPPG